MAFEGFCEPGHVDGASARGNQVGALENRIGLGGVDLAGAQQRAGAGITPVASKCW